MCVVCVCEECTQCEWLLFCLLLINSGLRLLHTDDFEDFLEEFEGSKIQYGFAKVKDPNQGIDKFVLINWVRLSSCPRLCTLTRTHTDKKTDTHTTQTGRHTDTHNTDRQTDRQTDTHTHTHTHTHVHLLATHRSLGGNLCAFCGKCTILPSRRLPTVAAPAALCGRCVVWRLLVLCVHLLHSRVARPGRGVRVRRRVASVNFVAMHGPTLAHGCAVKQPTGQGEEEEEEEWKRERGQERGREVKRESVCVRACV